MLISDWSSERVLFRSEERVSVAREFIAQLAIVVDAAVEHQRQTESGVDHGLCTSAGKVDDLQPPVPEGDVAGIGRAAWRERVGEYVEVWVVDVSLKKNIA